MKKVDNNNQISQLYFSHLSNQFLSSHYHQATIIELFMLVTNLPKFEGHFKADLPICDSFVNSPYKK